MLYKITDSTAWNSRCLNLLTAVSIFRIHKKYWLFTRSVRFFIINHDHKVRSPAGNWSTLGIWNQTKARFGIKYEIGKRIGINPSDSFSKLTTRIKGVTPYLHVDLELAVTATHRCIFLATVILDTHMFFARIFWVDPWAFFKDHRVFDMIYLPLQQAFLQYQAMLSRRGMNNNNS
jgi:hypothetical protein